MQAIRRVTMIVIFLLPAFQSSAQGVPPDCSVLEHQLEHDQQALRRQQSSIRQTVQQLEEWTKESQEAQKGAIVAGVKLLAGSAAEKNAEMVRRGFECEVLARLNGIARGNA